MKTFLLRTLMSAGLCAGCLGTHAQWAEQTLTLHPGWNAVFLELDPQPAECNLLLDGLPVDSVWAWNRRAITPQFIQDPSQLLIGDPDWLTYLPPAHSSSGESSLFTLQGGRAYLVRVTEGVPSFNWTVTGRPSMRPIEWVPDSLNLVGFQVRDQNPPTFQQFLAGAPAHAGQPLARLNNSGRWDLVNPTVTTVTRGEAYWVMCAGISQFNGPIAIELSERTGVDFGSNLVEEEIRIVNRSAVTRQITVAPIASTEPPTAGQSPVVGPVPLSHRVVNLAQGQSIWEPFTVPLTSDLAPGAEWRLRLEVRRRDMPSPGLFQSLLEVRDSGGAQWLIPVSAARSPADELPAGATQQSTAEASDRAGLWVGTATLRAVSQPSHLATPNTPLPTPAEFQFRLLVHVDRQGQARLLDQVLQMRKETTYKPHPSDPNRQVVDQPGRTVLITDPALASQYTGSTLRDGRPVGRRISSAAFAFESPVPLTGAGEFGAHPLAAVVTLAHNHPRNPFQHRYHPDHDNLDDRFENELPDGRESFTVTREITLDFSTDDPDGTRLSGWGDIRLGGQYRERILGLHRHPLDLSGDFRLQRASRVPSLNDPE
jgi:hypothetical protein